MITIRTVIFLFLVLSKFLEKTFEMNKIKNKLIMDWTFAKIESWAVKIAKKNNNNNKNERKHVSQQSTRKQKGVSCIWPSERKKNLVLQVRWLIIYIFYGRLFCFVQNLHPKKATTRFWSAVCRMIRAPPPPRHFPWQKHTYSLITSVQLYICRRTIETIIP